MLNPVKQAFDYDKDGAYVKSWLPEVRRLERLENVFQAWTTPLEDQKRLEIAGLSMATKPVKRIEFDVERNPKASRRPYVRRRGSDKGVNGVRGQGEQSQLRHAHRRPAHPGAAAAQ